MIPFVSLRLPRLARALLRYRYRRLREARWAAREAGFDGAMFPWQSGSDGREETQRQPEPPLRALEPRQLLAPTARQRRDRLQRLAVLPGHRRPRLPGRVRGGADHRDRALLELDRPLQPVARPLRDLRRDGSRRVPRRLPGRIDSLASTTTHTRTSWRSGCSAELDLLELLPSDRSADLRQRLSVSAAEIERWRTRAGRCASSSMRTAS